ncbi:CPBP family intramembrane glutamic endopeptidase [Fodinibius halophilus]|uniref:CPBP family intramembrane metalloprotease n=1 Tax=Fodinibius halophilus TaxID=1736908 RepID=A0A6M1T5G8_9BACT|nr:CPBP family intramembrane glutamic endopeptidase [Fodinibius halophilus]NGP87221.1 CPBP family intramembrane metalloprotease [Fodinibius halophilus]
MESTQKTYLYDILEGVLLFIGLPLMFYWQLIPLPKILALVSVAVYCGFRLWRDRSFKVDLFIRDDLHDISKTILIRVLLVAILLTGLVWVVYPGQLFAFPFERPFWWMVVMVLYPLLSALPQEFIFRTYFFHRFEQKLPLKHLTVVLSALAFAFLHIIYDNWWAIALSFIGGLFMGRTYQKTRSLYWVTLEHAIYGCLVFTTGMGSFFYEAM